MRLTKTMYVVERKEEIIDYDRYGNPIYGDVEIINHPISCEIEPFSNELAKNRLGLYVDASNRSFCEPNDLLELDTKVTYNDEEYKVTAILKYDKHYEVLMKKE